MDLIWQLIGGAGVLIAALWAVWRRGVQSERDRQEAARDKAARETRMRTDAENYLDDDISVIRDRLRERGKR